MKRIIISAVGLLVGGFVYSQSPAPTPPQQAEHIAIIPGAASTANSGQSQQNGNNNRVQVFQAGTNQSASTYQGNGSGIGGNLTYITQVGAVSSTSGIQNNAEAHQIGTANELIVDQQGDYNSALSNQGINDDGSEKNKSWIRQGDNQQAEHNASEVNQDGDNNIAKSLQTYDNSESLITQAGNENMAFSEQDAGPNGTDGHASEISQLGDANQAYTFQEGSGARNNAVTLQEGNSNKSYQTQENTATMGGAQNEVFVAQGGVFYNTNLDLTIGNDLRAMDDVYAGTSFQTGSEAGIAYQNQIGNGNDAETQQFGKTGFASNYSEQNQIGNNNEAYGIQNVYNNAGGDNYLNQDQHGNENQAGVAQNGQGHKAYQTQDGSNNIALSTQKGANNKTNIRQFGDQNVGKTIQNGTCNKAFLVQHEGQSYTISQNFNDPTGGGNQANIFQTDPAGTNSDVSCTFPDMRTEVGDYSTPVLTIEDVCPGC
ncbi:hypothetical protein [Aequorivita sp. CIP111184]|uniref:hypothetical protein n=1 Tax=Aequorivita sp. CIP111184 TaxID=2211356 RepID=UPI000DBBD1D9|nr:hypothetical protein [Aequorivita sp. CIP111184]SRX54034.1 hypothetical protein AEQU1_01063 [Aequorivita sp. CIP111184]